MSYWGFRPYVSVAKRRANAQREMAKLAKKGRKVDPVRLEGRKIAETFWGKAWCDNLESYSDYENRLPRGRTYVRNGSVCDLQIEAGRVSATVCGSALYNIKITIKPLPANTWAKIKAQCAGQIGSLVELLQGRLSQAVMEVVTRRDGGLFPKPGEITMSCSCPDWAGMCKHVAATLYGVGARLDRAPEMLFTLREVDHLELIAAAGDSAAVTQSADARSDQKTIAADDLADVFGIDIDIPAPSAAPVSDVAQTVASDPAPKAKSKRNADRRTRSPGAAVKAGARRQPPTDHPGKGAGKKKRAKDPAGAGRAPPARAKQRVSPRRTPK